MAQKGVTVHSTDFPPYTIVAVGNGHLLIGGGGGQAKTGVPNAIEILALKKEGESCTAAKVKQHNADRAMMNCCIVAQGKDYLLAVGLDGDCQLYTLRSKLVTPKVDGDVSEGLRKRKGALTDSSSHNAAPKESTFDFDPLKCVKTDFGPDGGFQKAVRITPDNSLMATGGSDGKLRTWKVPDLKKLYEIQAHKNEIDDLDISPPGNRIVTVSRDNTAFVWNTADGSKKAELKWDFNKNAKYRCRHCRFAPIVDKKDEYLLFTTNIPSTRGQKTTPCYITKWDTTTFTPRRVESTGSEVLSSFAVSDDGVFLATGTISGSVSVYIAFSLKRLYHLKAVHNIFVTGLDFAKSTAQAKSICGAHEFTLFSISADKQVKMHQESPRRGVHPFLVIVGFLFSLYVIFWAMTTI